MKKIISIIAALTLCLALTACSGADNQKHRFEGLTFAGAAGDYIIINIDSIDDVEQMSDLVVVGEFIDDASVCYGEYRYNSYFEKDVLVDIVSSCPMKITRVLSDNAGDAKVGDVLNVLQREGIWEDRFFSLCPLTPMQKGDEWVFCLSRSFLSMSSVMAIGV